MSEQDGIEAVMDAAIRYRRARSYARARGARADLRAAIIVYGLRQADEVVVKLKEGCSTNNATGTWVENTMPNWERVFMNAQSLLGEGK